MEAKVEVCEILSFIMNLRLDYRLSKYMNFFDRWRNWSTVGVAARD